MVDSWMGDDWFHNGASPARYDLCEQEATRVATTAKW
jgi:hypothetical protein